MHSWCINISLGRVPLLKLFKQTRAFDMSFRHLGLLWSLDDGGDYIGLRHHQCFQLLLIIGSVLLGYCIFLLVKIVLQLDESGNSFGAE